MDVTTLDNSEQADLERKAIIAHRSPTFLIEVVLNRSVGKAQFLICPAGSEPYIAPHRQQAISGLELVPLDNDLVRRGRIILPSGLEPYESSAALVEEIRTFVRTYVWIPPAMLDLVVHFVLYTWIYDRFGTAVYLHFVGDLGSGKSRALDVLARLCYHTFHAAGGTTRSALFRTLDMARGTLALDETDFSRWSEDHRDLMRMLRNGWQVGHPHMLSEGGQEGWEPRCYEVFGPKIIGGREAFPDAALESRCITIYMPPTAPVQGFPVSLPEDFDAKALPLRNKLLRWRADHAFRPMPSLERLPIEGRLMQVFEPLAATIALVGDQEAGVKLRAVMHELQEDLTEARQTSVEGTILAALLHQAAKGKKVRVKALAKKVEKDSRSVAKVCRTLGLVVERDREGAYVIFEPTNHQALLSRYGQAA